MPAALITKLDAGKYAYRGFIIKKDAYLGGWQIWQDAEAFMPWSRVTFKTRAEAARHIDIKAADRI